MTFKVIGIGELLWDLLPGGRKMGGAPANFAYHARSLGADARVLSCIGADAAGREIVHRLEKLGVPTSCVFVDPLRPTGTVVVEVAADGQPRFTIQENVAWDNLGVEPAAMAAVAGAHVVCFGTLAQRSAPSRQSIQTLVSATPRDALRIFDINLRQNFFSRELIADSLALANVLKLNDAELPVLARLLDLQGTVEEQLAALVMRYRLRLVAYTRGVQGSLLYDGVHWSIHDGLRVPVKDTVGAGDAFTAAVALGLLAGLDLNRINALANELAASVCSQEGATPPIPDNLRRQFESALATH